jgi:2,5-furandicarboxylate decarboxylase 1
VDHQSLRGFLAMVERDFPDELVRIREPVRRELDITATVFELERAGRSPVVLFERVEGFDMPVVTNVAGNRRLIAAALGVEPGALATSFRERCQHYQPVERVDRAPWQEVVVEGDAVDLTKLPIPVHFAVDAAPYITAGQICARDPETGVDTTGFHRLMLNGRNRLGVSLHSRRRMYEFHRRAEARGEPLPAVVTLGVHPIHYMGSMAFHYPPHVRKYEIIGALFGEPCRVAACGPAELDVPRARKSSSKARSSTMRASRKDRSASSPAMPRTAAPRMSLSPSAFTCGVMRCFTRSLPAQRRITY